MRENGETSCDLGAADVLSKGGHGVGSAAVDVLLQGDTCELFSVRCIATRNSHGTGCTLASGIAAGLAKGLSLRDAVAAAKVYLHQALSHGEHMTLGKGAGPVHHFFGFY